MALQKKRVLHASTVTGTTNHSTVGLDDFVGEAPPYIASLIVTALGGGTSLVVKIQHSPDDGVTWFDLISFAAKVGVGSELVAIPGPILPKVRAVSTFTGGTATATLVVAIHGGGVK